MPPKNKFTKEEIINAAVDLTRENGIASVTARGLGAKLGSSAKPIFGLFTNMEEVQNEVLKAANDIYQSYRKEDISAGKYPTYKANGMAYIRFANEEKELFKLLFMRDRTNEDESVSEEWDSLSEIIKGNLNVEESQVNMIQLEMWVFVHGIASVLATSYLSLKEELIGQMLSDAYNGISKQYQGK